MNNPRGKKRAVTGPPPPARPMRDDLERETSVGVQQRVGKSLVERLLAQKTGRRRPSVGAGGFLPGCQARSGFLGDLGLVGVDLDCSLIRSTSRHGTVVAQRGDEHRVRSGQG